MKEKELIKLEARVAQEIFGWTLAGYLSEDNPYAPHIGAYTRKIEDAMKLVDVWHAKGNLVSLDSKLVHGKIYWLVVFRHWHTAEVIELTNESLPLGIVWVALTAKEKGLWESS